MSSISLLRAVVALVGVAGALGCECLLDPTLPQCVGEEDSGPDPDPCDDGRCAVTSPGCDGADVERNDGETCATCDVQGSGVVICGQATVAECELRFDAKGEECRFCPTDTGEVLYDGCLQPSAEGDLVCEPAPSGPNDPVAPEMSCSVCRDERGTVVENRCEPLSDECHDELQGDVLCRICTSGGVVVVQECQGSVDDALAPDFCEAYQDDDGRCVDCWGDGALLSHRCSVATAPVSCVESVTIDGLLCLTCVDTNGVIVEQSCSQEVPEPQQCQVLVYAEQTCVVCLDAGGGITSTVCERNECAQTGACEPPPPCLFEYASDGQLCRSCPTDAGMVETQCIGESALYCEELLDPSQRCTVCYDVDTGMEVYRDCGGAPPPWCETQPSGPDGTSCEICYDPATGAPVYSSCDGQTCSYLGGFALTDVNGTPLYVDNGPAVAECAQCAGSANAGEPTGELQLSCNLLNDCGNTTESFVDTVCPDSVLFDVAPRACGNPWEEAGYVAEAATLDELLGVLSWALDGHGLALVSIDHFGAVDPTGCADCNCPRGDLLRLEVRAEDAARTSDVFGPVLNRCGTNDDCGGGLCRLDGSCSPP